MALRNLNIKKDTHTPKFIAALFTIARAWKQLKYPSMEDWIKKMWHIYIYIYTHIYVYIYIHTCMYTHTHIYTMENYQPLKAMKLCHLQKYGWTWRLSQS